MTILAQTPTHTPVFDWRSALRSVLGLAGRLRALSFGAGRAASGEVWEKLSDAELVSLARGGGARGDEAYGVLIRRHQGWVLRLVERLLHGYEADTEDVTQEAFIGAFLALDTWRGDSPFGAWLRTIATRTAFNWQRARQTAFRYEVKAMSSRKTTSEDVVQSGEHEALGKEMLESMLGRIAYPYREILILRYMEELSIDEISMALDIGKSAAKMRLKRAREQLKAVYERMSSDDA